MLYINNLTLELQEELIKLEQYNNDVSRLSKPNLTLEEAKDELLYLGYDNTLEDDVTMEVLSETISNTISYILKIIHEIKNKMIKLSIQIASYVMRYKKSGLEYLTYFKENDRVNQKNLYSNSRSKSIGKWFTNVLGDSYDLTPIVDNKDILGFSKVQNNVLSIVEDSLNLSNNIDKDIEYLLKNNEVKNKSTFKLFKKEKVIHVASTFNKTLGIIIVEKKCKNGDKIYTFKKKIYKENKPKNRMYPLLEKEDYIELSKDLILASEGFKDHLNDVMSNVTSLEKEFRKVNTEQDYDKCTSMKFKAIRNNVIVTTNVAMSSMLYNFNQLDIMNSFLDVSKSEWGSSVV